MGEEGVLPAPGELLEYDFRSKDGLANQGQVTLKCIQWNIERGYKLDQVISCLQSHRADIICLQELDIGCGRSGFRNCALEISRALKMKCVFFTEFIEISSSIRSKSLEGGGVHGNAILSVFDLTARVIPHTFHPINWEKNGKAMGEPRLGERAILVANVKVPGMPSDVICYSLHLEVFCGIFGRLKQFADVLQYVNETIAENPYQLIFGDLNTMAHGIARFSPHFCKDSLRMGSLGYSEARWWHEHLLSTKSLSSTEIKSHMLSTYTESLSDHDISRLVNPHLFDPFCLIKDTTLQSYYGLFRGKLDWTLIRGFNVIAKGMDNHHYNWSDHKLLFVILRPTLCEDGKDPGKIAFHSGILESQISNSKLHNRWQNILWSTLTISLVTSISALAIKKVIFD